MARPIAQAADGQIVGVVTISVKPEPYNDQYGPFHELPGPRAFVPELGVVPFGQGTGVGRALMRAAAEEIRRRGGARLAVDVDQSTNPVGRQAFFARCGLRQLDPARDDLLGAEVDEVLASCSR